MNAKPPASEPPPAAPAAAGGSLFPARKLPRQQRSRTTVESIKQATLQLLAEDGLKHCSTERIAARAGISIGSLYQYFPNREAVLQAVYEDVSLRFTEAMRALLDQIMDLPVEAGVARVVERVMQLHAHHHFVLLTLADEVPELNLANLPLSFNRLLRSSIRAYLIAKTRLAPRELDRKVFLIERIILGCTGSFLREPPAGVPRRAFAADLVAIISAYIGTGTTVPAASAPRPTKR